MEERLLIRAMAVNDIPSVVVISQSSFLSSWSANSYEMELEHNFIARYYCLVFEGVVVGYLGLWLIKNDARIIHFALSFEHRGKGWGEYMLCGVMKKMLEMNVLKIKLEVRESSVAAQNLYKKLGFTVTETKLKYYEDNGENGLAMQVDLINSDNFH